MVTCMMQTAGGGGHPGADPGGGVQRGSLPGRGHRGREDCQAGPQREQQSVS